MKDDDDDEVDELGAVRYPVMPSLVSLQQMRNRLQLAFLGKKLMKWTALATGKEMRRLALEMAKTHVHYSEDIRSAFILIARARYFYPSMNDVVLQNVPKKACVKVKVTPKSIAGTKIYKYKMLDNTQDPYLFLGIEKGGKSILETKKAWNHLIKTMLALLQIRMTFLHVELANKNANKKANVFHKLVIPKTKATIRYIKIELDDKEREEYFRRKRILQVKCKHKARKMKDAKKRLLKMSSPDVTFPQVPPIADFKDERCFICNKDFLSEEDMAKIQQFKANITEIIDIAKQIEEEGIATTGVDEVLKAAKQIMEKIKMQELEPEPCICDGCKKLIENPPVEPNLEGFKLEHGEIFESEEPEEIEEITCCKTDSLVSYKSSIPPCVLENDLELGTYETETQEITKILRLKNEDGTVTEEKRVIKIKKDIGVSSKIKPPPAPPPINSNEHSGRVMYQPSNCSSFKSNPYSNDRKAMIITVQDSKNPCRSNNSSIRRVTSEIITPSPPMVYPTVRSSLSSASNFTLDTDYETSFYYSDTDAGSANTFEDVTGDEMEIVEFITVNPFLNLDICNERNAKNDNSPVTVSETKPVSSKDEIKNIFTSKSAIDLIEMKINPKEKEVKKIESLNLNEDTKRSN